MASPDEGTNIQPLDVTQPWSTRQVDQRALPTHTPIDESIVRDLLTRIPVTILKSIADGIVYGQLHGIPGATIYAPTSTPLNSDFVRQEKPRKFFVKGRVFRVLWAQPVGEPNTHRDNGHRQSHFSAGSGQATNIYTGNHGGKIFHDVKIFVVTREGYNYCNAIQITSYGGRGVGKHGVVKAEHAIAYTGQTAPGPLPEEIPVRGEVGMPPDPIQIIPEALDGDQCYLGQPSRLNFGKQYTIEHNIRVQNFGYVHQSSMDAMISQLLSVHYPLWRNAIPRPPKSKRKAHEPHKSPTMPSSIAAESDLPVYKIISGTGAKEEEFAPDYKLRSSDFYCAGKVFTVLSCKESSPPSSRRNEKRSVPSVITDEFSGFDGAGVSIFTQRRWFVVIKEGAESSLCLRILSYEDRGVPIAFVKGDHSAVYTGKKAPKPSREEMANKEDQTTLKIAVRINQIDRAAELLPSHRVRYSTVYRVNHDVLACPFGEVHERFKWYLKLQTKAQFQSMDRQLRTMPGTPFPDLWKEALEQLSSSDSGEDNFGVEDEESLVVRTDIPAPNYSEPRFKAGDRVLLPGREIPGARARFKPLRVKEAKLVPSGWQWQYSLKHEKHDGEFARGEFFSEDRLIE